MRYFKLFMPDGDGDVGGNMGGEAVAPTETPSLPEVEESETGSVTADDVAKILGKDKVDTSNVTEVEDAEEDEPDTPEVPEVAPVADVKPADKVEDKPVDVADVDTPDFSVEVEDAEGKTHKIERIEDLPEDFEPKNNRQIMEILRDLSKQESAKASYEEEQITKQAEANTREAIAKIQTGWDEEIKSLQAEKRIPITTDPTKNERIEQIYKFMGEENTRREKAGKPPLATIEDVLDKLEKKEALEAKAKATSEAKETARKNGALIGGSSAPATGGTPTYKGGAKNANQALKMMGVL